MRLELTNDAIKLNVSAANYTFYYILIINTLFFSGYYILKIPLALILNAEGMPLKEAYSINTTANTLLALCAIYYGLTFTQGISKKFSLYVGLLLCTLAIFIFSFKLRNLNTVAIALYIIGGGLYFFNLIMFINKQFISLQDRCKGNFIYLVSVNIAGVIGCMIFLNQIHQQNIFLYCLGSCLASLIIFSLFYSKMEGEKIAAKSIIKFAAGLLVLLLLVVVILQHRELVRGLVMLSFCLVTLYLLLLSCKENDNKLFLFLALVYLFNIPYWIANTLIFNEFLYFLATAVTPIHGVSPMSLIIIDPIVNTVFGMLILSWFKNRKINAFSNLLMSSLFIGFAFFILILGIYNNPLHKLSFCYPLLSLMLFACAEFLLQATLNSQVSNLLSHRRRNEFLGAGLLRSSRAFAHVLGYYLISWLILSKTQNNLHQAMLANFHLYVTMLLIIGVSIVIFILLGVKCQLMT